MPTKLEMWNQALSSVGGQAAVAALDEASKEANACRIHYDNVRTTLLRAAHWGCARKQLALTELGNAQEGTSLYPWLYMYEYPEDCIKMRYLIYPPPTVPDDVVQTGELINFCVPSRANRFLISTALGEMDAPIKVIVTNVKDAVGIYTMNLEDVTIFDDGFSDALISGLASKLCLPITGNVKMKLDFEQIAMMTVNNARVSDGNEAMPSVDHTPDWIAARGSAGYPYAGPDSGPGYYFQSWDNIGWGE